MHKRSLSAKGAWSHNTVTISKTTPNSKITCCKNYSAKSANKVKNMLKYVVLILFGDNFNKRVNKKADCEYKPII